MRGNANQQDLDFAHRRLLRMRPCTANQNLQTLLPAASWLASLVLTVLEKCLDWVVLSCGLD